MIPKRGAAWAVHMLTLHLLGGLNFDHPQLSIVGVVRRGGFFFDHSNEIVVIKEVGDRDGGAGASGVGDKAKGGIAKLGDGSVKFSKAVQAGARVADDNHGTKVAGLCLAAKVEL